VHCLRYNLEVIKHGCHLHFYRRCHAVLMTYSMPEGHQMQVMGTSHLFTQSLRCTNISIFACDLYAEDTLGIPAQVQHTHSHVCT